MKRLKRGKAVGPDGIPTECFARVCEGLTSLIAEFFTGVLQRGVYPKLWRLALLLPLLKKPTLDPAQCDNYRGISIITTLAKLFGMVLEAWLRLTRFLERTGAVRKEQFGFVRDRMTI